MGKLIEASHLFGHPAKEEGDGMELSYELPRGEQLRVGISGLLTHNDSTSLVTILNAVESRITPRSSEYSDGGAYIQVPEEHAALCGEILLNLLPTYGTWQDQQRAIEAKGAMRSAKRATPTIFQVSLCNPHIQSEGKMPVLVGYGGFEGTPTDSRLALKIRTLDIMYVDSTQWRRQLQSSPLHPGSA